MNIAVHSLIGISGYLITGDSFFLIGSFLPDISLIPNEIILVYQKKKFNSEEVPNIIFLLYKGTHCLFFMASCWLISSGLGAGVFAHQIADWISHSGKFSTQPFFPIINCSVQEIYKCLKRR